MREQVQQGNISIAKIPTKKNVADLLTKPLYGDLFWQHLSAALSLIHDNIEIWRSTDVCYCYETCIFVQTLMYIWTDASEATSWTCYFSCVYFWEFLQLQHIVLPHQIGVATQGCQLALKGVSWTDSSVVEDSTHSYLLFLTLYARRLLSLRMSKPSLRGGVRVNPFWIF